MKTKTFAPLAICALLSGCAHNYAAVPSEGSGSNIRFVQGVPTASVDKPGGTMQITSLGYIPEDNRLIFGAAAFNKGRQPVNFGLDAITITSNGVVLSTYTRDQLAHEAKVKAAWAAVAMALAGAAAAYAANQNAYRTTSGYVAGPGGVTTFSARTYDPGLAYAGTAAATAGTAYGLASINNSLDRTIASLNGEILQTNTVDPGTSAGGAIVVDMPKAKAFPQPLNINVRWNGEAYSFDYTVVEKK